ncbi:MAG: PEP-CTERM sorting domain-containing protein [Xenococcaceae cyanobacterium MO_167.B52]|nr:PEP-CTERM sorting domain-containing protein [Xenococcaceae cyanobacterium MO_167.B52]
MPHDVIYDPNPSENFAYVSILGLGLNNGTNDVIVKFDTTDFTVVDFQEVGLVPHLSATSKNEFLYVPVENSNAVQILDRDTLDIVKTLNFEGAHGTGMSPDGSVFCTTNFLGGTEDTLSCIDTAINEIAAGNPIDTPVERAHNLVFNGDGTKLYVTHSSTDLDLVSFYSVEDKVPSLLGTVNTGTNPFGIAFVPNSVPEPSSLVGLITTISIMAFSRLRENQSDD